MDTVALSREEFLELPEYSCTLPTGTIGKRWKRVEPYQASRELGALGATWYLGEYVGAEKYIYDRVDEDAANVAVYVYAELDYDGILRDEKEGIHA